MGKREVLNYVTWLSYPTLLPSVSYQGARKGIITLSFACLQFIALSLRGAVLKKKDGGWDESLFALSQLLHSRPGR